MPIQFNPSGLLDIGTDPADLPAQTQGKMTVSGAMTRCTNLNLDRTGIASTRKGSVKINSEYDYIYSSRKMIKNADLNPDIVHYYDADIWGIAHSELKDFLQQLKRTKLVI